MPKKILKNSFKSLDKWLVNLKLKTTHSKAILLLSIIGYDTEDAYYDIDKFRMLISNYKSRYLQKKR